MHFSLRRHLFVGSVLCIVGGCRAHVSSQNMRSPQQVDAAVGQFSKSVFELSESERRELGLAGVSRHEFQEMVELAMLPTSWQPVISEVRLRNPQNEQAFLSLTDNPKKRVFMINWFPNPVRKRSFGGWFFKKLAGSWFQHSTLLVVEGEGELTAKSVDGHIKLALEKDGKFQFLNDKNIVKYVSFPGKDQLDSMLHTYTKERRDRRLLFQAKEVDVDEDQYKQFVDWYDTSNFAWDKVMSTKQKADHEKVANFLDKKKWKLSQLEKSIRKSGSDPDFPSEPEIKNYRAALESIKKYQKQYSVFSMNCVHAVSEGLCKADPKKFSRTYDPVKLIHQIHRADPKGPIVKATVEGDEVFVEKTQEPMGGRKRIFGIGGTFVIAISAGISAGATAAVIKYRHRDKNSETPTEPAVEEGSEAVADDADGLGLTIIETNDPAVDLPNAQPALRQEIFRMLDKLREGQRQDIDTIMSGLL